MQSVVECTDLVRRFGDLTAVDRVSFTISEGETYGLLGPNGAGKTTTISMVAGLLSADAGRVVVAGRTMTTTSVHAKRSIGLVPQDLAIYPDLTARENLRFFGKLYGMRGADLVRRIDEVLDMTGLSDRADDRSEVFSGGMKRRLNIGIGLLHEPSLLILDEPTVGVDPQSRNAILDSVEALGRRGMAVLYTTHYMEEAERLCDRIAIIDEGRFVAEGTRRELIGLVGSSDRILLDASGPLDDAVEAVRSIDGVGSAGHGEGRIEIVADDAGDILADVIQAVAGVGVAISTVEVDEPNLEDVFLHLTGRALRD